MLYNNLNKKIKGIYSIKHKKESLYQIVVLFLLVFVELLKRWKFRKHALKQKSSLLKNTSHNNKNYKWIDSTRSRLIQVFLRKHFLAITDVFYDQIFPKGLLISDIGRHTSLVSKLFKNNSVCFGCSLLQKRVICWREKTANLYPKCRYITLCWAPEIQNWNYKPYFTNSKALKKLSFCQL